MPFAMAAAELAHYPVGAVAAARSFRLRRMLRPIASIAQPSRLLAENAIAPYRADHAFGDPTPQQIAGNLGAIDFTDFLDNRGANFAIRSADREPEHRTRFYRIQCPERWRVVLAPYCDHRRYIENGRRRRRLLTFDGRPDGPFLLPDTSVSR